MDILLEIYAFNINIFYLARYWFSVYFSVLFKTKIEIIVAS